MKAIYALFVVSVVLAASEPWSKGPQNWTADDAERILTSSPWAQTARATLAQEDVRETLPPGPLPGAAQAGMAGPRGASDGAWDGGVGRMPRGAIPTVPVLIRWDSALPVRDAAAHVSEALPFAPAEDPKHYLVTLIGLVPGKRYRDAGKLNGTSRSDDTVDGRDPEELLEGLMATSRLLRHGRRTIAPDNVRVDGATGAVQVFFPRTDPIVPAEKEIVFRTRFGSLSIEKVFRLKEMTYKGHLEL